MKVVIIGNGISGTTCARWVRKLGDDDITIISSETKHFFSRTALMYVYMGHMRYEEIKPYEDWFWVKNRINLIQDHVIKIDTTAHQILLKSATQISYDRLILALGSKTNKFGWPGQELEGVSGLYKWQDLEVMEQFSPDLQRAVIVGGGLIGIEMAEMFKSRNIPVTMLVRENEYWDNVLPFEEARMVSRHIRKHHIDLRLQSNLKEIHDNGSGRVKGITIAETGETIDCGFVGLTPGVSPNISLVRDTPIETQRGIMVDEFLRTNIQDIYAIGDCAQQINPRPGRASIEAVWYTGRIMGKTVAHNICGQKVPYSPGIWFNSAKFLDMEYQVYGTVLNHPPDHHKFLYWEHEDGEKSIKIVFDKNTLEVLGFNLMGLRFRHEVCEKWIRDGARLEHVVQNLQLANFNPEFHERFEPEIVHIYNQTVESSIRINNQTGLNKVIRFLQPKLMRIE